MGMIANAQFVLTFKVFFLPSIGHVHLLSYLLTLPLFAGVSRVRALSPAWTGSHAQETLISRTHLFLPQQKNQVQ